MTRNMDRLAEAVASRLGRPANGMVRHGHEQIVQAVLTELRALDGYPFDTPEWFIALDELLSERS